MRIRVVALTATLSIAGLAAASLATATVPSGGGSSGGGGGGGGAHASGGGGGGGGGHSGGGYSGGHFGGGHFGAGGYRGGGYTGGGGFGGHAGYAAHASYMAHGGYVAHGSSGYHVVGYESAGPAGVTGVRGDHAGRITLALGPRTGSAAAAARLYRTSVVERADHMHPRPGHPGRPGYHPRHPHGYVAPRAYLYWNDHFQPLRCDFAVWPSGKNTDWDCLTPTKRKVATAGPTT